MVIHYKCPSCGADMKFDSTSGKLSCGSCGRKDEIETFPQENILQKFDEGEAVQYHCDNCGADIVTDADTTATSCCFCGAGVVLADRLTGDLAPAYVIPFQISKDEAQEAFKKWCRKGRLTPKGFMTADRIKNITGMYVPFWLYDLNSKGDVEAVGTRVRKYTRGDYIYTETKYYDILRSVDLQYVKVPVDASEKMDDQLMDKLEPYDYSNLKDFNTPYLAGYIAEKYNFDDKQLLPRVQNRVESYVESYVKSTMTGYHTTQIKSRRLNIKPNQTYYTLIPVWMVYYDYGNKEHIFAMNGQTGKVVGKPPISAGRVATWFAGIAASTFVVLQAISLIAGGGF